MTLYDSPLRQIDLRLATTRSQLSEACFFSVFGVSVDLHLIASVGISPRALREWAKSIPEHPGFVSGCTGIFHQELIP